HRSDRFPRSTKEPDLDSRRLQAGCRSGRAPGLPPNSSQGPLPSPRFRHRPLHFDTSSAVRWCSSLQISPDGVYPAFSCDAHHQRSERQQLAVVWSLRLIAGSEGPTLISLAAPHLLCSWCARGTRSVASFKCRQACRRASVVPFLGCQIEKAVDELNLSKKIISCHPSSLPLPDHVDCFVALNRSSS